MTVVLHIVQGFFAWMPHGLFHGCHVSGVRGLLQGMHGYGAGTTTPFLEGLLSWGVPLTVVAFLWGVNSNLRGTLTPLIEGLLSFAIFILVAVGFYVSGWIAGAIGLVAALQVCGAVRALSPLGPLSWRGQRRVAALQRELRRELGKSCRRELDDVSPQDLVVPSCGGQIEPSGMATQHNFAITRELTDLWRLLEHNEEARKTIYYCLIDAGLKPVPAADRIRRFCRAVDTGVDDAVAIKDVLKAARKAQLPNGQLEILLPTAQKAPR